MADLLLMLRYLLPHGGCGVGGGGDYMPQQWAEACDATKLRVSFHANETKSDVAAIRSNEDRISTPTPTPPIHSSSNF